MDILLIDPPYASLRGMPADVGYNVGLTSLAGFLRQNGVDSKVLMGDLLMGLPPVDGWMTCSLKEYAERQPLYRAILHDEHHVIWQRIAACLRQYKPAAVGISYLTPLKCVVEKVAALVKETDPAITVVVGGAHPTFCSDDVMENHNIDFAVRGEGEVPLLALAMEMRKDEPKWEKVPGISYRDGDGGVHHSPPAPMVEDLDSLPFAARDLVIDCDYDKYRAHCLVTARGCPYNCSFCADKGIWRGKVRRRSVENVMDELDLLARTYRAEVVDILDGTFTYDRKYVERFCREITRRNLKVAWGCTARYDNLDPDLLRLMKQANCGGLFFGLESGSDRILKAVDKKTNVEQIIAVADMVRDAGITCITSVVVGLPGESKTDTEATLRVMERVHTDIFDVNSYVPLPGSRLHQLTSEAELKNIDWEKVAYKSLENHFSKDISHADLRKYLLEAYQIADDVRKRTVLRLQSAAAVSN